MGEVKCPLCGSWISGDFVAHVNGCLGKGIFLSISTIGFLRMAFHALPSRGNFEKVVKQALKDVKETQFRSESDKQLIENELLNLLSFTDRNSWEKIRDSLRRLEK